VNQLYQYTPLQSTFSVINIALVNRAPRTLSLRDLMTGYLNHRKEVIRRRTAFLLRRARQRAHVLEGLILAMADIDRIIELIKASPDVPTARQRLIAHPLRLTESATVRKLLPQSFVVKTSEADQKLTGVQADAILSMQLQRLTGLEIEKLANDYSRLVEEIEGHEAILSTEELLLDIVREDVHEIKDRYGDVRRTEIVAATEEFDIEDLIAEEDVVVTLTHEGYIKRMPLTTYRRQGRGGQGIIGSDAKEGDFVEQLFVASTHEYMLVFLNNGRMHWLKVYDIPSMARQSKGRAIVNMLDIKSEESICAVVAVREFDERFLLSATRKGQIKKTALKAYANPRRGGIQATGLAEDDVVIGVAITRGADQIVLGTANGQAIRFDESEARPMGRTAAGVRGIHLREGDEVVDMAIVDPMASLLTVCQRGYGKRTSFDEYRVQSRGGYGIINIKTTDRNGKVVAMKSIRDADELMLITSNGMIVRTGVSEIRTIGRATQGVRMITLKSGDELVSLARVVAEDNTQGQLPMEADAGVAAQPATETSAEDAADDPQPAQAEARPAEPSEAEESEPEDDSGGDDVTML
ncbi:MAG: DNA gyrase C-terminal beta-propeller domain-containing protein, partial [Planctomycetota bacterium]